MPQSARRRTVRAHALRLDPSALVQTGIAATITMFVAWLIQQL